MEHISLLSNTLFPEGDSFSIAFSISDFSVRWYAIFTILGYALAILVFSLSICYKYKIKYEPAFYFIFPCLIACFFGARFWSACIGDLSWNNFFNISSGGFAIEGGVFFGTLVGIIFFPLILRKPQYHIRVEEDNKVFIKQPSFFIYADAIIPTILIGQAIGRWGNFFNGEIFGSMVATNAVNDTNNALGWLKVLMPGVYDHMIATHTNESAGIIAGAIYQPLFLYESFLNIIGFSFIYFVLVNLKSIKCGTCAGTYFVYYAIVRFAMEPLRNHNFTFAGTYIMNTFMLLFGIGWIIFTQFILFKNRNIYFYKSIKKYFGFDHHGFNLDRNKFNNAFNISVSKKQKWLDSKIYRKDESNLIYFNNH